MPRRSFLQQAGAAASGTVLFSACGRSPGRWRFFTNEEAETVTAIAEQIIPADQDPGAADAGVPNFIDKQLSSRYKRHQDTYRQGLAAVDSTSRSMFGKRFAALAWDDQTRLLKSLESGKVPAEPWRSVGPAQFFEMIRDHSLQGFYGSPRHGGNRDYVSYRMLRLEYPQVIGRNRPVRRG